MEPPDDRQPCQMALLQLGELLARGSAIFPDHSSPIKTSEPVSLAASAPTPTPRSSAASPTSHRTSRTFLKSLFTEGLKDIKGKGQATPQAARSGPAEEDYVVVDSSKFPRDRAQEEPALSHYRSRTDSSALLDSTLPHDTARTANSQSHLLDSRRRSLAAASSDPPSSPSSAPTPSPPNETTSLPLEWARSSIPLHLPRGHGPILFFRLSRLPPPELDFAQDDEDEDGVRKPQHLFLAVATARTVYLFESRPSERRTWIICNEFYVRSSRYFARCKNLRSFAGTLDSSLLQPHPARLVNPRCQRPEPSHLHRLAPLPYLQPRPLPRHQRESRHHPSRQFLRHRGRASRSSCLPFDREPEAPR